MQITKFLASLLFILGMTSLAQAAAPTDTYLIQPGDILRISVWGEESLQGEFPVRPDGVLSVPLAGDVKAAGKPVETLRTDIAGKLTKYIPDPVVTIVTLDLRGNTVYVIGKVNRPGPYQVQRNIDVVQALSMAGGMTAYAAANKIKILRRGNDGTQQAIPFEYGDIEKGENLEQNIILQAGDVVVVP